MIDHQSLRLLHIKIQRHVVKTMGRKTAVLKSASVGSGRADTALKRAMLSILGVSKLHFANRTLKPLTTITAREPNSGS